MKTHLNKKKDFYALWTATSEQKVFLEFYYELHLAVCTKYKLYLFVRAMREPIDCTDSIS
jgi:hypothetical protein